jgi:hypothetical protein
MYNIESLNEQNVPPIMFEGRNNGSPPSYIIMNIADNATPGEYEIPIEFTYTDGEKWYQDEKKLTIHVNNPVEENRQILAIFVALIGIIFALFKAKISFPFKFHA